MATLVRIDRNGTKYYEGDVPCSRCGGAGGADVWKATGWKCYKCGGSGTEWGTWKEYTPEYEAKLTARRMAQQAERDAKEAEEQAKRDAEREEEEAKTRAEQEAREAEIKAQKAISQFVGEIGDKVDATVTFDHSAWWEQPAFRGWGTETMYLHCFRDEQGNMLVWKTTKSLSWQVDAEHDTWATLEQGDKVHIKGTIKEHNEYDDEKQTSLTRCKVIPE